MCHTIQNTNVDVLVFTEMATCGYFYTSVNEVSKVALSVSDEPIQQIIRIAQETNTVVVVGFAERDGSALYNSCFVAGPNIPTTVYRKSHLFYKEKLVFSQGDTGFVTLHIPHLQCTLGLMICYDWRFPESARTLALKGADIICCPANLVTHIWRSVMPARAIENKVYLVVANRYGTEEVEGETVSFNGQSAIYSYNGDVLDSAPAVGDAILTANVYPEQTRDKSFNSLNNIFSDRRPELYL